MARTQQATTFDGIERLFHTTGFYSHFQENYPACTQLLNYNFEGTVKYFQLTGALILFENDSYMQYKQIGTSSLKTRADYKDRLVKYLREILNDDRRLKTAGETLAKYIYDEHCKKFPYWPSVEKNRQESEIHLSLATGYPFEAWYVGLACFGFITVVDIHTEADSYYTDFHGKPNLKILLGNELKFRQLEISTSESMQKVQEVVDKQTETKTFAKLSINICSGNLITQQTDVIVVCSSSEYLFSTICKAAGNSVKTSFQEESKRIPKPNVIAVAADGEIAAKKIYFLEWTKNSDKMLLQTSIEKFVTDAIEHAVKQNYRSIAFPAIGCGQLGCSISLVAQAMITEARRQLVKNPISVVFVIQPERNDIYDEFCKQLRTTENIQADIDHQLPTTWILSTDNRLRFDVPNMSDEYKSIFTSFHQTMNGKYTQILQIERIQNERWYIQYIAHSQDFRKRLQTDTERRLFHGCPEAAVNSIIKGCFNRSFAGKNATVYGVGAYFSANALYSHDYTAQNGKGERNMFVARVLVGKSTHGNSSMKTPPLEFDSTTDGNHIFVTYHDAQAYAEYLVTYK